MRFNSTTAIRTLQKNVETAGVPTRLGGHIPASSTISFTAPSTISDSAGKFLSGGFRVADTVTVSGSADNNIDVTIVTVGTDTITVKETTITTEGTSTVTLTESGPGIPVANGSEIRIKAKDTNNGNIYLGYSSATALGSNNNYFRILAGGSEGIAVKNLNTIWIDAQNSGEGVDILYEI